MILEAALLVAAGWVALGIRRQFPKRAFDCFIDESKPMHKNRRDTGFAVLAMVAAFPVGAALLQGSLAPMVALGFAMFAKGVIEKSSQISHRFSDVLVAGGLLLVGMKPQYVILPLVVLLGLRRWKAIGFTAIAQAILMALSALIVRPSAWIDYLKLLGIYNREIDTYGSGTSSMINIRGILAYTLGAGRASTINVVSTAALLAAAIGIGFLAHRARNAASKTALVIAMLLAGMIASPHAHSHDWTVALVALALAWFLPGMTSGKRLVLALVPLVSYLSLGGFDSLIGKLPVALAFGGLIVAIRFMRADETYLS